jgi:hypothetical protein
VLVGVVEVVVVGAVEVGGTVVVVTPVVEVVSGAVVLDEGAVVSVVLVEVASIPLPGPQAATRSTISSSRPGLMLRSMSNPRPVSSEGDRQVRAKGHPYKGQIGT